MERTSNSLIVVLLALIFVALAWRFLLVAGAIALSLFMWLLLFKFCLGVAQGIREIVSEGAEV